jgi:sortase A
VRRTALLLVTAAFVAASCGGGGGSTAAPAPTTIDDPIPRTSAIAVTTLATVATTTIPLAPTPTTTPDTVAAATTVLPTPIAPPPENAKEPLQLVGTIEIPKLGITEDMFEGIAMSTLDHGPGHWPGTAMPGQVGNVVVAGHRVSHSKPFRHIDDLVEGDEVRFTMNDTVYTYEVTGHEVVPPTAIRIVDQTAEPTATLFACHPPGSVAERYVVYLKLKS